MSDKIIPRAGWISIDGNTFPDGDSGRSTQMTTTVTWLTGEVYIDWDMVPVGTLKALGIDSPEPVHIRDVFKVPITPQ
jgi:hypothetical protein